jgi:hypothetical protein
MHGEITLAGVTLTLEEWETLDRESQELLLSLAVDPPEDARGRDPGERSVLGERTVQMPAMIDLLANAARS